MCCTGKDHDGLHIQYMLYRQGSRWTAYTVHVVLARITTDCIYTTCCTGKDHDGLHIHYVLYRKGSRRTAYTVRVVPARITTDCIYSTCCTGKDHATFRLGACTLHFIWDMYASNCGLLFCFVFGLNSENIV